MIAAFLFQYFLAVTQMSQLLADALISLPVGPLGVVIAILAFYIITGMFIDEMAMILLTIPIVFPIVTGPRLRSGVVRRAGRGHDPDRADRPPVGIICFIMNNMVPDIGLVNIYKGAMPFVDRRPGLARAAGGVPAALARCWSRTDGVRCPIIS